MARRRYRGNYRSNYGRERALRHIEEARQLSEELGGSDKDVKDYFLSLPAQQLRVILDAYEQRHGGAARKYAEKVLPKWRTGRVTMSGTVATRLFGLLPPRMPLTAKYRLTEDLWRHVGPSSRKTMRIGLDAGIETVLEAVRNHIQEVVVNYKIPTNLERRFEWLSGGDVRVKQELLNHLLQMEKSLVVNGAREQLSVLLDHLRGEGSYHTHRLAHILKVGKHELEMLIDKTALSVTVEHRPVRSRATNSASRSDLSSLWWVVGIGLSLLFLLAG
jgi:hypothetical protein